MMTKATTAPRQQRPAMICSNVPGTWAYDTMSRRINEEILERTVKDIAMDLAEPSFATIRHRIELLRQSLATSSSSVLPPLDPPDHDIYDARLQKEYDEWSRIIQPYQNDTWLTAPWLIAEFYVYRQLMQCFDYFNPISPGYQYDPFHKAKHDGLVQSLASAETCLRRLKTLPHNADGLALAVGFALWGNQMDLSLWPAASTAASAVTTSSSGSSSSSSSTSLPDDRFAQVLAAAADQLLADDTAALATYCFDTLKQQQRDNNGRQGGAKVDIVVDNAGFELVTDLALATFLIESGIAQQVTFQLKAHPTFVSDALTKDLLATIAYYETAVDVQQYPSCVAAATQWRGYLTTGQWKCHEDFFWVQPLAMAWQMTEPLRSDMIQHCDLAFVKGDANYRRLLGDGDWDWTTPFGDIVVDFPVPICALRTLKAELGCGMSKEQTDRARTADPHWMTNGKFGVVQFANYSNNRKPKNNQQQS
jgi:Damage-control phosphatase ARMT1-like domain